MQSGAILDGFPRNLEQAKALDKALAKQSKAIDKVVYIKVSEGELLKRLGGRWICRNCQAPYHEVDSPPKVKGKCDRCGGELYQRADDNAETVKKRLEVYFAETAPLIDYYKKAGKLVEVNGEGGADEVNQRILAALAKGMSLDGYYYKIGRRNCHHAAGRQNCRGNIENINRTGETGMKTKELDIIAERELKKRGAESSFKGYRGYPATVCVSVNDEIVHGIPGERVLKEGDIVSLDFGAIYNGFQGDAAVTVPVGEDKPGGQAPYGGDAGLAGEQASPRPKPGPGWAISPRLSRTMPNRRAIRVVREYTGHGIGRKMHEDPQIPNCTEPPFGLSRAPARC